MENLAIVVIGVALTFLGVIASYIALFQQFRRQRKDFEEQLAIEIKEKTQFEESIKAEIQNLKLCDVNLKKDIEDVKELSERRGTELVQRLDRFEDKIDKLSEVIFSLKAANS